ncbi:Right handed beta helix region [Mariniphaga anaerophila]|uniref:Right handed beta helix region n=1 Tax=Mariniphaga anaerophila TaxID=1484053 RepID=A0A1M5BVY3_9BACT|nr:glycoside hydrolase family 28 protein [Mariniphaga anaerophila]SHF46743.1 Right handed beta helix region [Mariniphaga anaerophila]
MIRRTLSKLTLLLIIFSAACTEKSSTEEQPATIEFSGIEFNMPSIQEPVIPDYAVSITDFGAKKGGKVLNTQAFADAIEAVSKKGGGKVVIPAGIWLTGPIHLKSNLELHAETGALIVFSDNKDLYPLVETSFEGLNTWRCMSPIYGVSIENVAFTGTGVWDGSGDAWRYVKRSKLTASHWKKLVASGGVVNEKGDEWYPSEQFRSGMENADQNIRHDLTTREEFQQIRDFLRPVMVSIQNSKQVLFDGPTFQNSPAWCLHPLVVENLIVRNVTVRNPWYSQNGDGLDIESCKNVLVENCNFDVGDDAICIKSGKDEDGRQRGIPCENLVIRNNTVFHGHGGVTVGSEMSGGVKNMHVSNCTFIGTDVGLRFKSNRGRGGVVEDIFISNIQMKDIPTFAISFNLYYGGISASEMLAAGGTEKRSDMLPVTEETPQFKDIKISDIIVDGALQAVLLQGLPEMNLENISLNNMILSADQGITIVDATGVKMTDINIETKSSDAIVMYDVNNVDVNGLDFSQNGGEGISINGSRSAHIFLKGKSEKPLSDLVSIGDEVDKSTIKLK